MCYVNFGIWSRINRIYRLYKFIDKIFEIYGKWVSAMYFHALLVHWTHLTIKCSILSKMDTSQIHRYSILVIFISLIWHFRIFLKSSGPILDNMRGAEKILVESDLDYTVVLPAGLLDGPASGNYFQWFLYWLLDEPRNYNFQTKNLLLKKTIFMWMDSQLEF